MIWYDMMSYDLVWSDFIRCDIYSMAWLFLAMDCQHVQTIVGQVKFILHFSFVRSVFLWMSHVASSLHHLQSRVRALLNFVEY